jgi:predicted ATPase
LKKYDPYSFCKPENSFKDYLYKVKINRFRHLNNVELSFDFPITVISGDNRIGKTSILLLIACSFEDFYHLDSTKPETSFRRFTWKDVIKFTRDETDHGGYSYELFWRVGTSEVLHGVGKRDVGKKSWTGLGKLSHTKRQNAKIRNRNVRFIDLERILPARGCSTRLNYKASHAEKTMIPNEIINYYKYIFKISTDIQIYQTGSHINKRVFLIERPVNNGSEAYSSFNDASGEESILNMLIDIVNAGENSLILIDELECGIHPETQRRLADIIQFLSWTKKQQYIITTHSATLLSAFPQKARKLIENNAGVINVISKPSVNVVFSKLDSVAHPLIKLYCEDDLAKYIIRQLLIECNHEHRYFDRIINILTSGGANDVKCDYLRHKHHFVNMIPQNGYCAVYDGDKKEDPAYNTLIENDDFIFFISPNLAPEKALVGAYLSRSCNDDLLAFYQNQDHHLLFEEMVRLGIASDTADAQNRCWTAFSSTPEHASLLKNFKDFIYKVVTYFSEKIID